MIKCCFILETKLQSPIENSLFMLRTPSEALKISEGCFYNISSLDIKSEFTIESANAAIGASLPLDFSSTEPGKEISIEVASPSLETIGTIRLLIGMIHKDITEKFVSVNNEVKMQFKRLQSLIENNVISFNTHTYDIIIKNELQVVTEKYNEALKDNQVLISKLESNYKELEENYKQIQTCSAENFALRSEIYNLTQSGWETEKNYKNRLMEKEKSLLDYISRINLLEKTVKKLSSQIEAYDINDLFPVMRTKASEDMQKTEVFQAPEDLINPEEIYYILNTIENLLEKQSLSLLTSDITSINPKTLPKKLKDDKHKSKTLDEKFSEYLKAYGLENDFERIGEEIYTLGNKKISITMRNGYLVCRVGGGYMMIDQFLKSIASKQQDALEEKTVGFHSVSKPRSSLTNRGSIELFKENFNSSPPKRAKVIATTPLLHKARSIKNLHSMSSKLLTKYT